MSSALADSLGMFAFLAVELSLLFLIVAFLVSVLRQRIPQRTIDRVLGAGHARSYWLAAGIGALTPFCSCSTIPMLKGLIRARAGFGPMMVFLFTSPLLNPIVVVLLAVTFGLRLTAIYMVAALLVSLIAGWALYRLGFARHIRESAVTDEPSCESGCGQATEAPASAGCGVSTESKDNACGADPTHAAVTDSAGGCGATSPTVPQRPLAAAWSEALSDFRSVLLYLLLGIAIGSFIYGYIPADWIEQHASGDSLWTIPLASVIGVPLYLRAEALIPIAGALLDKGVASGAVLALIIGGAGASLTELILLRALFSYRLLIAFLVVIFSMAMLAGFTAVMLL
ncbi:MAG: permease [Xanthomonadales bacterium]|nr:permease [Xanthomonadales bacterium]